MDDRTAAAVRWLENGWAARDPRYTDDYKWGMIRSTWIQPLIKLKDDLSNCRDVDGDLDYECDDDGHIEDEFRLRWDLGGMDARETQYWLSHGSLDEFDIVQAEAREKNAKREQQAHLLREMRAADSPVVDLNSPPQLW